MAYNSDIRLDRIDDEVTSRLGAINAIYRGTISVAPGGTNTATITAVTTARTIVTYSCRSGRSGVSTAPEGDISVMASATLTNSTTITATGGAASPGADETDNCVVEYEAVEFGA